MPGITKEGRALRLSELYAKIVELRSILGCPASIRELADAMGYASTYQIRKDVARLSSLGKLRPLPTGRHARAIQSKL